MVKWESRIIADFQLQFANYRRVLRNPREPIPDFETESLSEKLDRFAKGFYPFSLGLPCLDDERR